ncbi:uncharacterized protein SAMN05216420_11130 [Nitrosospira sp. Nl5]|uniref:TPM domain-containing protein n=1 Tax=Nitrosospira sp. Nl5 TaxID=200120 RepID=UPI00088AF879|nr:YgcG family protein [Nitrosospira sp. Nl5]SCY63887.1 uncharacterized protein SAMN05216420_11130 [Nitrosospira sp. Nl5]
MSQAGGKVLALIALLLSASLSGAEVAVPPLKSPITDLTGTLSQGEIAQLEQKLAAFEAKKGSQIAVLLVPTTQPETVEQYSIRVAEAWKLGRKGVDDGVLLVIAKQDRVSRIEVGYGLEGVLPDAVAKRIVDEIMIPEFRQGDFAGGIAAAIGRLMGVIEGEPLPPPRSNRGNGAAGAGIVLDSIIPIFIGLIVLGKILQSLFGRLIGATVMSVTAGLMGWLIFSSIIIAMVIAVLVLLISLFGSSGGGISRGGRSGWPGGGLGRGRGGFGGGGFRGGGGGFGGGGASGRW